MTVFLLIPFSLFQDPVQDTMIHLVSFSVCLISAEMWGSIIFSIFYPFALVWTTIFLEKMFTFQRAPAGWGRERRTEDPKRALCWQQRSWCGGTQTHKLWEHDPSRSPTLKRLSRPGAPRTIFFNAVLSKLTDPFYRWEIWGPEDEVSSVHLGFYVLYHDYNVYFGFLHTFHILISHSLQ